MRSRREFWTNKALASRYPRLYTVAFSSLSSGRFITQANQLFCASLTSRRTQVIKFWSELLNTYFFCKILTYKFSSTFIVSDYDNLFAYQVNKIYGKLVAMATSLRDESSVYLLRRLSSQPWETNCASKRFNPPSHIDA